MDTILLILSCRLGIGLKKNIEEEDMEIYERKNGIVVLIVIEALLIALSAGTSRNSLLFGIIVFIGIGILYMIPIIGQALGAVTSLAEASMVFELLRMQKLFNIVESVFISIIIFLVLIYLHNRTVGMADLRFEGFGWLLFEAAMVSVFLYELKNSIWLSLFALLVLIILSVIPRIRVVEFIGLSISTGYVSYRCVIPIVEQKYAFLAGTIIFIYSIIMYIYVYKSLDYIGMKKAKAEQEQRVKHILEYQEVLLNLYKKYSELEKEYYYYKTSVCVDSQEREEFENDWEKYIFYLNDNPYITFNCFFENEKMYKYRFYNRDYANSNYSGGNKSDKQENEEQNFQGNETIVYFKGVKSMDGLKSRYRELMKIYHTDNPNGDNEVCQIIQEEYNYLLKMYREKAPI